MKPISVKARGRRPDKHHETSPNELQFGHETVFLVSEENEIILRADDRKLAWCEEGEDAAIHERTGLWNKTFKPTRIIVQPLFVNSYNYGFRLI